MGRDRFHPLNTYKNFKTLCQVYVYTNYSYLCLKGKDYRFFKGWSLYCQYWGLF